MYRNFECLELIICSGHLEKLVQEDERETCIREDFLNAVTLTC